MSANLNRDMQRLYLPITGKNVLAGCYIQMRSKLDFGTVAGIGHFYACRVTTGVNHGRLAKGESQRIGRER
jgi:hypothetical protein